MTKSLLTHALLCLVCACSGASAQISQDQVSSEKLIVAFRQGAQNNCAAIAVVKLAIAMYGTSLQGGVFKDDVLNADGSHNVVLRDDAHLKVTKAQIEKATQLGVFTIPVDAKHPGDQSVLDRANLMYAVMAQHAVDLGLDDASSFDNSIGRFSDPGRNSDVQPQLLGLGCKEVALSDVSRPAYIHANYYHAAFATMERLRRPPQLRKQLAFHCQNSSITLGRNIQSRNDVCASVFVW